MGQKPVEGCLSHSSHAAEAVWRPVIDLIDGWSSTKISRHTGYSLAELDAISVERGIPFPAPLRAWWHLAGRHPIVGPSGCDCYFTLPVGNDLVCGSVLLITIEDAQTGSGSGILLCEGNTADPRVVGINTTIGPSDDPSLDWIHGDEGVFATDLDVPSLVHVTLLFLMTATTCAADNGGGILRPARDRRLKGGEADPAIVSELSLKRFSSPALIGDVYTDARGVIYHWLTGIACRTASDIQRVKRIIQPIS